MSKKMNFSKHMKRFCAILSLGLIALSLTACDSSNRHATGGLDLDAKYASAGNYSVTVGELYDSLRYGANTYLESRINNAIYDAEIKAIDEAMKDVSKEPGKTYKEKFEEIILKDIYGTDESEEIEKKSEKEIKQAIDKFRAKMYKAGYVISEKDVKEKKFEGIYSYFELEVAKFVAAKDKLSKEFTVNEDGTINFGKIDDDSYFTIKEVVKYYNDNKTNKGDVTSVLIRFMTSKEASNLLRAMGIKTYDGAWFQIDLPNPDEEGLSEEDKTAAQNVHDHKNDYDTYYADYSINPRGEYGDQSIESTGLGKATILKIFIAIYNYIYNGFDNSLRDPLPLEGSKDFKTYYEEQKVTDNFKKHLVFYNYIKDEIISKDLATKQEIIAASGDVDAKITEVYNKLVADLTEFDTTQKGSNKFSPIVLDNETLNDYSSSLATYLYETLEIKAEDENSTFNQYSTSAKSYGDYYYLVFKIDAVADTELYTEKEDADGNIEYTLLETPEAKALLTEILNEMFEDELTTDYITKIYTERAKDAQVRIYDSIVELQFMQGTSTLATSYEKTKKKSSKDLATVKYAGTTTHITVAETFSYLEALNGATEAMSILFDKKLMDSKYYKDLAPKYDEYVETIEAMLNYFANDYYAQYGYPSALGKYNFMMLYYRTANIDEAIHNSLMVSDARNAFFADITKNYGGTNLFTDLKSFADKDYDEYYSLSVKGVEVYLDINEDGTPDKELTPEIKVLMDELLADSVEFIKNSDQNFDAAITKLLDEYKNSSRVIDTANPTLKDLKWTKYRQAGLYLKTNDFGEVTNTTILSAPAVQERVEELYTQVMDENHGFLTAVIDDKALDTKDGRTVLLVTAGKEATSAKYEVEDGKEFLDVYKEIPVIKDDQTVIFTFTEEDFKADKLSEKQIEVYVRDYLLLGDVFSLPATTKAALDAYIKPLLTRYTSEAGTLLLIKRDLGSFKFDYTAEVTFGNEAFNTNYTRDGYLTNYIEIAKKATDDFGVDRYPTWWDTMYTNKEASK